MATPQNVFGQFFRQRRQALGLNLSEFCRLNGFDKGNISRLERGVYTPPNSVDSLETFAHALQLAPDSEDWKAFMGHAAIARGRLPSAVSAERAVDVEAMFRRLGRRLHDSWVKARYLEAWSLTREAEGGLPTLVRQLIHASTERPTRIEMPGGEGVQRHGWDGVVEAPTESQFVPAGVSAWEISTHSSPPTKAEKDFNARKEGPLGLPPSEVTFIFVTSRKWDRKQEWRDEKRKLGKWKNVEVYDSSDLEACLELAPGVDVWMAERLGRRPPGVISIDDYWQSLSRLCEPRLRPDVFLASRETTATQLREFLLGTPGVLAIECRSPAEALDFAAAYLALTRADNPELALDEEDRVRVGSRTVVVRDRAQWDGLSHANGSLNMLLIPSLSLSPEELNAAVMHGHRVLVAAAQFSNHRMQPVALPRPSRDELETALRKSGFQHKDAVPAARAAGGSLSVLKRHLSVVPVSQSPQWCRNAELNNFLPILLAGAWDEANEVDRAVLSRLAGRPYSELQNAAQRLALVEDAPLTRINTRWRLVSPEDSWTLVGAQVTDGLLDSFETVAIEILSQEDQSLSLSPDARLEATLRDTVKPTASEFLRCGVSETIAILGSNFGTVANLPPTAGRQHAARIVRTILHEATWLRWATLGDQLPLLAEAAPNKFLAAISADLKTKHTELAKLLADDEDEPVLTSTCRHAGLLRALEGLAWSPELFPNVCTVLGRLAEVDHDRRGGNRPAASLGRILLPWYPQTAAGVDKRIAVLRSLADSSPAVAWGILFAMLPRSQITAGLTRRPVWRDWMSTWREGASIAERSQQEGASAEWIVRLVGNDPGRWCKVLDKLDAIPEPYRNQLVDRLRDCPVDQIDSEQRRALAERLRKTIQRHRHFADGPWALPAASVEGLEQVLERLLPDEIHQRHTWLFVAWPRLEGFRGDYDAMDAQIERLRADALREIVEHGGFDGVLKLADIVESPGQVGATLAQTGYVPEEQILPDLLTSHQSLAAAYAQVRLGRDGWDWVRTLSLDKWSPGHAALLLSQAGLKPEAWHFAETLGEDMGREYWKTVPTGASRHLDQQQIEFACRRLLEADRPEEAIRILAGVTLSNVSVSPSLVMDALTAHREGTQPHRDARLRGDTLYTIEQLFEWLQETIPFQDDEPTRRLGQLEWEYLDLFDGADALPRTLIYRLSESPEFFAALIALIFRSTGEREAEAEPSEEQQQRASHGYRLLLHWKRIPGTHSDDAIDEEQLLQWLESARSLCRDSGHLEAADSAIGEMLASCPQHEDELSWPCEAVRDAIEATNCDDLDRGFQIGVLNRRGVIMRSPLDGGDLERKEAANYRRWAELCDIDWPRTAASLRSVAESYEFDAQREDARAADWGQDRH